MPVARLSPRERQVLELLAHGLSATAVATELGLSPETVRTHVRNAMRKLDANTRVQAVALAVESGAISPSAPR
jgi:DNA-binding CsgD family transcriptional regulator